VGETFYSATDRRCKTSGLEQEILTKLGDLGLDLVPQIKRRSWVFDAGVQGTRILIEVNGAYWHSLPHAKERDAKKAAWATKHGYTIITIAEEAYEADPDGVLLQVVDQVEQLRSRAEVDKVDTDAPISSYTFDDWRDDFIASLSGNLNVRHACIAADISRSGAYKRRDTDEEFRLAWDEAEQNACDLLEGVYWQRAIEQSDRALEFLLKANRREKYGERSQVEHTGKGGGPIENVTMTLEEWKAQAAQRLADAEATLALADDIAEEPGDA
jgi:very-short-patch-repair endonuclease